MGASAYDVIEYYQHSIQGEAIVEIGSARGEGSTNYFIDFIAHTNKKFYTVDVRSDVIDYYNSKKFTNVQAINDEHTSFADIIHGQICFAYLDSFDYIPPDDSINHQWMQDMIADYKQRNPTNPKLWLTNENSAQHHLDRTKKLLPLMSQRSIFLFDDTFVPADLKKVTWFRDSFDPQSPQYRCWQGKGATAVPYLIDNGWKVLPQKSKSDRDDYAVLANFNPEDL